MSFGFLFSISVVAGAVGALSGMGGGVVLVPALTFLSIDIKQAIAIGNLSAVAVSTAAASDYVRRHMPNLKTTAFLEVFAVVGALVGALIAVVSEQRILFLLYGATLLIFSGMLWLRRREEWSPVLEQDELSKRLDLKGSYYDHSEGRTIAYKGGRAPLAGVLMCVAGMTSGLLGIGGSALAVLVGDSVIGLPPKVSLTTSNLIIGVMALAGANVYLEAGLINPNLVAPAILGTMLGSLVGSKLLVHLPNPVARAIFLAVFILLGSEMLFHGLR